jgi:hypothetical protein
MNTARFPAFLVTLLLSGILPLDVPAQASGDSSATGYVTVAREDGSLTVSFSAVGRADAVAGQIDIHDSSPLPDQDVDGTGDPALAGSPHGVALQAEVNCLAVDGDTAIVGGEVTRSNLARYLGKQVLLFVEDSVKSQGRFTWGFYEPQKHVFCGTFPWAAYTPERTAGGSLQVQR